jgi:hypothetical protein
MQQLNRKQDTPNMQLISYLELTGAGMSPTRAVS